MKKVLLVCFTLLLIAGCSQAPQIQTQNVEKPEMLSSERLIIKLESIRRNVRTFNGKGDLSVESKEFSADASFLVKVHKPDSIYLNIFGPFGISLADILVSKEEFTFYNSIENTVYTGDVNQNVLKNIFKIDLSFEDIVDAFAGSVNLSQRLYSQPDSFVTANNEYVMTYFNPETKMRYVYNINLQNLTIKSYTVIDRKDEVVIRGKYTDFRMVENVLIPFKVELSNNKQKQKITIDYNSVDINKNNSIIQFKLPSDANIIEW